MGLDADTYGLILDWEKTDVADQLLTTAQEDRMTWKPISSAPSAVSYKEPRKLYRKETDDGR